jgi:hypothetical protein
MNLNCTCHFCDNENAYHNGVNYECPDCDSEWDENGDLLNDYDQDDEGETNEEFESLCKLEIPFFTLNHGKLYQCKVDFYNQIDDEMQTESVYIIPLAFEKNKNCFWVLNDAKTIVDKYPEAIEDFIEMDYTTIWNDGINCYFDDSRIMPISNICTTTESGTLMDYMSEMYDFEEVN